MSLVATSGVEPDFALKVTWKPLLLIRAAEDGVALKAALSSRTTRYKRIY